MQSFPIDAVITWVDGTDPHHKQKLDSYIAKIPGPRPRSAGASRFHSVNEIDYCVASLLKFAPWINTIYIVTDEQAPAFLEKLIGSKYESRVKIVDHKIIFSGYEDCLPSFSSMSIASLLWRIPGLAERFLFLNDDFSLIRPLSADAFYRDGKVVLRGVWRTQTERQLVKKIVRWFTKRFSLQTENEQHSRVRFIDVQENSAKMLGFHQKVFKLEHNPHPWVTSVWRDYFEQNPTALKKNISFQLRSSKQFVPEGFSAHCLLKSKLAIVDNRLKTLQIKPGEQAIVRIKAKLSEAERDNSYAFVCIQNLESASPDALAAILSWLDKRIGRLEDLIEEGREADNT